MSAAEPRIAVIIPALNEEQAIGGVVSRIPDFVDAIIVADNGSTDLTAERAADAGAQVVFVPEAGYGRACLAGVAEAKDADILVFLDGDGSDVPEEMISLIAPILSGEADMVIGSRVLGEAEAGSLTLPQRFGNKLACVLMRLFWGAKYTDLGPFRAIRRTAYERLDMVAPTYGWTVEMQVRALKQKLIVADVPVNYAKRIGVSKISGTVRGVVLAGVYILGTIFAERLGRGPKPAEARAKPQVFDMSKNNAFSQARDAKLHSIVS
ncbi:MAG: glycosyltransferase family 2 protein [Hyphomonadaceae bacterium]